MIGRKDARAGGPGRIAAALILWKSGLFGCMFIMSKKVSTSALRTRIDLAIRIVQMLGFVLTSKYGEPWPATMAPLELAFNVFNSNFLHRWYKFQAYLVLYYIAFGWVVLLVVLMAYGITGFIRNKFPSLFPLRVLQVIGNLSAGPLYIPLLQMLLSTFQCNSKDNMFWRDAGVTCSSTSFMIQQAVSAILALSLFVLSALFAAIYYESNSLSRFPDARAHGRADIVMLIVQAALVLVGQTFYDVISTWLIIITAAASGLLWVAAYFVLMPYYQHAMNCANIAGAAAFLWAVLCLTFNNYYPATDAAVWLYCGAPVAALAGLSIANFRANYILKTPPTSLVNAFEIELKGRYMLHAAIWGHPLEKASESFVLHGAKAAHGHAEAHAQNDGAEEAAGESDLSDDVEDRAVQLRKLIPPEVLASVQQLYRQGASRFRTSSFLHVFCARFYSVYLGNRHMQFSHLLQAEKRSPSTDVSYLVFQARKLAEDTTGGGAGMSAMNRVTFEKYAADARRYVMLAAQQQLAFWAELLESLPDLSRLHKLSTETNDAVVAAEKCFGELFAINPQSLGVIRLYAAFNTHVTCNLDKSMALTAEADRLEDMKSKDHSMEGATRLQFMAESTLDIMAENTAIVTLGASVRNLGLISAANASSCKLFGYARLQLERRSGFTLLPPPLDRFYEKSLKRYLSTGEGNIVDYNRIIFGLHKTGAIMPLLSSVRDAPSDGGPPSFIWLMRELRTPSQYIILDETNTVLGATAGASTILGVELSAIASREIRLPDYIAEWHIPSIQNDLLSAQGAIIKVEARVTIDVHKESDNDEGRSIDSGKMANDDSDEGSEDAAMNEALKQASKAPESTTAARTAIQETWIRAHLQHVELEDLEFWVAHLQRTAYMDSVAMQRIEERRAQLLAGASEVNAAVKRGSLEPVMTNRRPSDMSVAARRLSETQSRPMSGGAARRPSEVLRRASLDSQSAQYLASVTKETLPVIKLPRHMARDSTPATPVFAAQPSKTHKFKPHRNLDQPMQGPSRNNSAEPDIIAMLQLPGSADPPAHSQSRRSSSQDQAVQFDNPARENPPVLRLRRSSQPEHVASNDSGVKALPRPETSGSGDPGDETGLQGSLLDMGAPSHGSYPSKSSLKHANNGSGKIMSKKSMNDRDGLESRSSGGSSKGTTVSKSMVRLRRLLSDGTRGLLPGLWWLRIVGIGITILAIALAVTVAIIARTSFYDYMDHLNYVRGGAQRLHYKADVYYSLQDIVYHARGWAPLSDEDIEDRRKYMVGNATLFADTHREMFEMAQQTPMKSHYTTRYITITVFDIPENGVEGQYKIMNLVEAGNAFVNAMIKLSQAPLEQLVKIHDPLLDYVYFNWMRNGNGHESLQKSMAIGYEAILEARATVYNTQVIVFVCMTVLICVIGAGIFLPILRQIESSADNIMKQFVTLPNPVRIHMHKQALGRVRTLRREFAQDDDAEMSSSGEDEGGEDGVKRGSAIMHDEDDSDDSQDHVDWDDLLGSGSRVNRGVSRRSRSSKDSSSEKRKKNGKLPYRKSSRSFLILVLRFIGPLVSLLLMFVIIFAVFADTLERAVTLTSIATAANYRASCARQAMANLRKFSTLTAPWEYRRNSYWIAMKGAQCMRNHVRLLGFGDGTGIADKYVAYTPPVENGSPSVLSEETTAAVHQLMFADACPFVVGTAQTLNSSQCLQINGGILGNGMATAAEEWYSRAYKVADEQLRKIYEIGQLQFGNGWITPASTFHYNNTACKLSEGCYLRDVSMPASGSVDPAPLYDFSYPGDINTTETPPPEGSVRTDNSIALESANMNWLEQADTAYLTPVFFAVSELYETEADNAITKFITFLTVFMPAYMTSFVLIIAFIFMPQVVVARIPSIKMMVDDILATDTTHLATRARADS